MQLAAATSKCPVSRCYPALAQCPQCGNRLVAPELSELIDGDEIRHHWSCEACGQPFRTSIALIAH
jgi:transcription elongation factor Elf1